MHVFIIVFFFFFFFFSPPFADHDVNNRDLSQKGTTALILSIKKFYSVSVRVEHLFCLE